MNRNRYLLGILSKIKLYNNTFKSRKVTVRPEYFSHGEYFDNTRYDIYEYDGNVFSENSSIDTYYTDNEYTTFKPNTNNQFKDLYFDMDASSPLNSVNVYDGLALPTSTLNTVTGSTTTAKSSDMLHPRLIQLIQEVKEACLRHFANTPRLQTGRCYI